MKKFLVTILIIVIFVFLLSRLMVQKPEPNVDYSVEEQPKEVANIEDETEDKEEEKYSFEYSDIHFSHSPNDLIKVSITYPQFKDEKLATLNTKIEDFAKSNFKEIINDENVDTLELTLEETYSVKLANEKLVSIASTGELTKKDLAYPSVLRNVLNVDPMDFRRFKIEEIITINSDFVKLFKETSAENEQLGAYLSSFSDEEIQSKIQDSKIYIDGEDVVIVFNVPHAIGDYIEVKIAKENIQPYLTELLKEEEEKE